MLTSVWVQVALYHPGFLRIAARDYEALVEGVNGHKEILLSYNISVDRRDRQKDKVARTARRVGLEVPEGP